MMLSSGVKPTKFHMAIGNTGQTPNISLVRILLGHRSRKFGRRDHANTMYRYPFRAWPCIIRIPLIVVMTRIPRINHFVKASLYRLTL
jgi:hypothetical protein